MSATYYLLHFVPDLEHGTRFTIGAVLDQGGALTWAQALHQPPADYLRPGSRALLELVLPHLPDDPRGGLPVTPFPLEASTQRPGTWPPRLSNLGNHFRVEAPRPIPEWAMDDPVSWLRERCLPRPPGDHLARARREAQAG